MRIKYRSRSIFWSLFGVLDVKCDLDRTGIEKQIKKAKIALWPRVHFLDLQCLYEFWTADLTTVTLVALNSKDIKLSFLPFRQICCAYNSIRYLARSPDLAIFCVHDDNDDTTDCF